MTTGEALYPRFLASSKASGSVETSRSTNSIPRSFNRFLERRQGWHEGEVMMVTKRVPFKRDVLTSLSHDADRLM